MYYRHIKGINSINELLNRNFIIEVIVEVIVEVNDVDWKKV